MRVKSKLSTMETVKPENKKHIPSHFKRLDDKFMLILQDLYGKAVEDLSKARVEDYSAIVLHYSIKWKREVREINTSILPISLKEQTLEERLNKWIEKRHQEKLMQGPVRDESLVFLGFEEVPQNFSRHATYRSRDLEILISPDGYVTVRLARFGIPIAGGTTFSMTNLVYLLSGMNIKRVAPYQKRNLFGIIGSFIWKLAF